MKKPNYRDKIDDFPRDIQAIKQLDDILLQLAVRIISSFLNIKHFKLFSFSSHLLMYKLCLENSILQIEHYRNKHFTNVYSQK